MAVFDALSWFYFQLPPPPQAQQNGQVIQPAQPIQPHVIQQGQAVAAAPLPGFQPHLMGGQASNAYPPPQQYYPQQNGYHPQQPHTHTVVVNQHHHIPQQTSSSGDGFATGMKIFNHFCEFEDFICKLQVS